MRLDVAVEVAAAVDGLQAADGLVGDHQHRLEREAAAAEVGQVVERGAQEVGHEDVVLGLDAVPQGPRDPQSPALLGLSYHFPEYDGLVLEGA